MSLPKTDSNWEKNAVLGFLKGAVGPAYSKIRGTSGNAVKIRVVLFPIGFWEFSNRLNVDIFTKMRLPAEVISQFFSSDLVFPGFLNLNAL